MPEHWKDAELARDERHFRKLKDQVVSKASWVAVALAVAFFIALVSMIGCALTGGDGLFGVMGTVMPWICAILMLAVAAMTSLAMSFEDEARAIKRSMGELPDAVFEYRAYKNISL